MEKIFVTGGSGFIGSHLISKFEKKGFDVTNYDLCIDKANPNIRNIEGDIMDYEKLSSSIKGHENVCHLAAIVGVVRCLNSEKEVYRIDYEGVGNIIKACEENGVKNILFASSSEVYGEGHISVPLEESMVLKPRSPYGIAKMKSEQLLKDFAQRSKMKVTVVRYCNIYGFGQRCEFVIPIFIKKVLKGETIKVCGEGNQIRSFTYIDDAVEGTINALFRPETEFDIFNISSSSVVKIIDVAKKVIELNGNIGRYKLTSYEDLDRKEDVEVVIRIPSTEKSKQKLGYVAKTDFIDGLKSIFDCYKRINNII